MKKINMEGFFPFSHSVITGLPEMPFADGRFKIKGREQFFGLSCREQ